MIHNRKYVQEHTDCRVHLILARCCVDLPQHRQLFEPIFSYGLIVEDVSELFLGLTRAAEKEQLTFGHMPRSRRRVGRHRPSTDLQTDRWRQSLMEREEIRQPREWLILTDAVTEEEEERHKK